MEISHTWACVCVRDVDVILKRGTHNAARFQPFAVTGTRLYFSLRLRIYSATATAADGGFTDLGSLQKFLSQAKPLWEQLERDLCAQSVKSERRVTDADNHKQLVTRIAHYGRCNSASPKCDEWYKRVREKSTGGEADWENCEHCCTDFPRLRARSNALRARRPRRTDFGVPIDLSWSAALSISCSPLWRGIARNCGVPRRRDAPVSSLREKFGRRLKASRKLAGPNQLRAFSPAPFVCSFVRSFVRSFSRVKVKVCERKLVGT